MKNILKNKSKMESLLTKPSNENVVINFYDPNSKTPSDFDWENTKVKYSLKDFDGLHKNQLTIIKDGVIHELGKIISKNVSKPYEFNQKRDRNIQSLINLSCHLTDLLNR